MKQQNVFDYINVDGYSLTPKYLQLANSIQDAVITGKIKHNRVLPSLHELTTNLEISKETADRGYKYLRELGILSSIPGKGHYINTESMAPPRKIFLLINKLCADRKKFYDIFTQTLGKSVLIDFYIYNDDFTLFKKLINNMRDGYSHYVILPHFEEGGEKVHELINKIPKHKLILLDKHIIGIDGNYGAVFENFSKSIYLALEKVLTQVSKYHTIKLVYPENVKPSVEISKGFNMFCSQYAFERSIINDIQHEQISQGEVFICMSDDDLVVLIERIKKIPLKVGEDVGIISYNEIPLKKYILNGITTISTNFEQMGIKAAKMILKNTMEQLELDCQVNIRPSI